MVARVNEMRDVEKLEMLRDMLDRNSAVGNSEIMLLDRVIERLGPYEPGETVLFFTSEKPEFQFTGAFIGINPDSPGEVIVKSSERCYSTGQHWPFTRRHAVK